MLNFSPEKLFLVGVIALIVLGPSRLPQAARTLGRLVAEIRRVSSSFQSEVREALAEPTEVIRSAAEDFRVPDLRQTARDTFTTTFPAAGAPSPAVTTRADDGPSPASPDDPSLN